MIIVTLYIIKTNLLTKNGSYYNFFCFSKLKAVKGSKWFNTAKWIRIEISCRFIHHHFRHFLICRSLS
jgi:hypothetical protein